MFCQGCGKQMEGGANFCSYCGRRLEVSAPPIAPGSLVRSRSNRMLAGICAGLAYHQGMDPTVVRLLAVVLAFVSGGAAILAYIVAWVVIPEEPLPLPGSQMVGPTGPVSPVGPTGQ